MKTVLNLSSLLLLWVHFIQAITAAWMNFRLRSGLNVGLLIMKMLCNISFLPFCRFNFEETNFFWWNCPKKCLNGAFMRSEEFPSDQLCSFHTLRQLDSASNSIYSQSTRPPCISNISPGWCRISLATPHTWHAHRKHAHTWQCFCSNWFHLEDNSCWFWIMKHWELAPLLSLVNKLPVWFELIHLLYQCKPTCWELTVAWAQASHRGPVCLQ